MSEEIEPNVIEEEAKHQGWAPKEEWKGPEEDWIDAETFVKRGKEINPILKKNNERLLRELDGTKKQMEELRKATEEFRTYQKTQTEQKVSALQEEIKTLREEKKLAITSGDGERVVAIDEKIDDIKEQQQQVKETVKEEKQAPAAEPVPPEMQEWLDKNFWYKNDVRMAAAANVIAEDIRKGQPWLNGADFLEELDKALEENFSPERLGKGKKKQERNPVEGASGGSRPGGSKGKNTYESLPADVKAQCDVFVKQKLLTKEQYVEDYYSQF